MSDVERQWREMASVLNRNGEGVDPSLRLTRRLFVHKSVVAGVAATSGAAAAAFTGWFPMINTMTVAHAEEAPFTFAWISDTHLYPETVNTRFVDKLKRAAAEVQAMQPPADFLIFGGDIAQLGRANELDLGNQLLKEVTIKKVFIPGEHDWYFDMGAKWRGLFGDPNWTFDHKGVRFVGLDTVSRAPDYWSARKMSAEERMDHMATLDGTVAGPWAGVGTDQLMWLQKTLADWPRDQPIMVFSHNPLYEYYPPWNFWVRDWRQVNEILAPYTKVTNIHGHVHQVLYNEIGNMRSIGMLATAWPWPYAPEGVPRLTREMVRVDPGDPYDGVGWGKVASTAGNGFDPQYMMWGRKEVFAQSFADTSASHPEILRARIADNGWFYPD